MTACLAWVLVIVRRICPACRVCVATPCSNKGRLDVLVRMREPQKQRPPVVHQRHHAGHESAAREILSGEAAPAPLIFQLIKIVLGIRPVTIQLGKCQDLMRGRGNQHGILITRGGDVGLDEGELFLAVFFGKRSVKCVLV